MTRTSQAGRRAPRPSASKGPEQQPGNTFRYLYWRLSEKDFQRLCAALLRKKFDPVQCFPVGMSDGGIDIAQGSIIYQVKWTSKFERDPVTWLKQTIEGERANIKKLIEEGRASRYILMTSVASTSSSTGAGTLEKLQQELDAYGEEFGIPVECWWQAEIDAEVDDAGDNIKWSYQAMLAGTDAIRYLIFGADVEAVAAATRETMLRVLATQWEEDARVRFSQVELDGVSLAELFVDVQAGLIAPPRNAAEALRQTPKLLTGPPRGAVETLLGTPAPLTFLVGVPGQGKSTLTQYLCQVHRAVILPEAAQDTAWPRIPIGEPKLPLRIDVKEYAAWVDGFDTFDDLRPKVQGRRKQGARSAEAYIAELCEAASGGRAVSVEDVQSLLERYPCLIVFDGLDEVADPSLRRIVVDEIELLAVRMGRTQRRLRSFQIVVTARPNATNLPEPSSERFQRMRLEPMNDALQSEFVVKWCDARHIDGAQRHELRRIFRDRTTLDHVSKLADNPMQLAILLYLISKKGDAVPVSRTPLYSDYMSTLLDREVARGQIDRNAVPQVQEVTAFIGWHMQSGVETKPTAGALARKDLETTLLLYLREIEADHERAPEIFRLASDRFWALTSETEGLFRFAVQPVREYFAARFLAEWGGRTMIQPLSKQAVLRELLGRPYWLNTARFYAGFASPNELAGMRYGVEDALRSPGSATENRVAAWALLMDAVFMGNTPVQRDVVRLLTDDVTLHLARDYQYKPDFAKLTPDAGGTQLSQVLRTDIASAPAEPMTTARVDMLRDQSTLTKAEFTAWWTEQLEDALGSPNEAAWLAIGARFGIQKLKADLGQRLNCASSRVRVAALTVGAEAGESPVARALLRSVLDGEASDVRGRATSEAGALLVAMQPQWFHRGLPAYNDQRNYEETHVVFREADQGARNSAWDKLIGINPAYAELRSAVRRRQQSQVGTTEPWQQPARVLTQIHEPSWLAAEIALTGAAAVGLRGSGTIDPDGQALGANVDYGTLVAKLRRRPGTEWWGETFDAYLDALSRRTWAVALLATASIEVLESNLDRLEQVVSELSNDEFWEMAGSSSRIALNGSARKLPSSWNLEQTGLDTRVRLLLAHWQHQRHRLDDLGGVPDVDLVEIACPEPAAWPVAEALASRLLGRLDTVLLEGLAKLGTDSLVGLSGNARRLDQATAEALLQEPGRYPTEWILHAETTMVREAPSPLAAVALERNWVPRVPQL
ncbi:NACHT domain-containing protein [Agromyces kandeliae]|uniref:Uncharacterized protein n=1 Tax=Agromyces kandeliae TaxID=2666141 RepID=A0A6L5R0X1_9MICO|nr:hypothetical protein [Agromyces kandeliae]MRX43254.1 hypothetical protein [Agromyces kandeliae]